MKSRMERGQPCPRDLYKQQDLADMAARAASPAYWLLLLVVLFAACAHRPPAVPARPPAESLSTQLDRLFDSAAFNNAFWGVIVQSADNGEVLYSRNADKLLMPASNMKLLTAAAALTRLGPDFKLTTEIRADGAITKGVVQGRLLVIGSGDPTISARFVQPDGTALLDEWARQLKGQGIVEIAGDIVGLDDFQAKDRLGDGWAWDDLPYSSAAEVSALQLDENSVTLWVKSAGNSTAVSMTPETRYIEVVNQVAVAPTAVNPEVTWDHPLLTNRVIMAGLLPADGSDYGTFSVHDPAAFFVFALREALERNGIRVDGQTYSVSAAGGPVISAPTTLLVRESPPLADILKVLLKVSQNLYAETLVRVLGKDLKQKASFAAGERCVEEVLTGFGIPPEWYIMADGSGLSRNNYVTPRAIAQLLVRMRREPGFQLFYDALPVAGVDGTLKDRMIGTRAERNVHAKTGAIANVRSLSGYVTTADGELLVFSMIANNFNVPRQSAEAIQDQAMQYLAAFTRKR